MTIKIGGKKISFEPIGTLLIGSRGRVDVIGPFARTQLILLSDRIKVLSDLIHVSVSVGGKLPMRPKPKPPSEIKWVWRILTRPPRREIIEMSKDNFLNLLVEVSNG
jgi:hypothetical protein